MMYSSFETQLMKITFFGKFEKFCEFSLKMSIFCNIYVVDKINN